MLSAKMEAALNEQIKWELYSAYLYYSMAAYFESKNLPGFARWMNIQAMEEVSHAHKFFRYTFERGARVKLSPLDGPEVEWSSPIEVFEEAFKHEVKVSDLINKLVDLAISERDHATNNFLQWFVAEQVEEEASADEVVQKLKRVAESPHALFMLDKEMGARPLPALATMIGEQE